MVALMARASMSALKANLARHLAMLKFGRPFLVTVRVVPAAVIGLFAYHKSDKSLTPLVTTGQVTPPEAELPEDFFEMPRFKDSESRLSAYVLDERKNGR